MEDKKHFLNRREAGQLLAEKLKSFAKTSPIVMALPRGGVPVAAEVARVLRCDLDLLLIKRIVSAQHPEVALGAVAEDGTTIWNRRLLRRLSLEAKSLMPERDQRVAEMRAQRLQWKKVEKKISLRNRVVIIVDDGIATGATMKMAVQVMRQEGARKVVVAAPVASLAAVRLLKRAADEVTFLDAPPDFMAVGQFYDDFSHVEDKELMATLDSFAMLNEEILKDIAHLARPFSDQNRLQAWVAKMAQARVVMLGEASHGTEEFYRYRRLISQILIEKHGFRFIAVEGDWPDCYKLQRRILGQDPRGAHSIMADFRRWPSWMWANLETARLIEWMVGRKAGFYGLDIYSLYESLDVLRNALPKLTPNVAERVREVVRCFEPYGRDENAYAKAVLRDADKACEKEIITLLTTLIQDKLRAPETTDFFNAEQNALIIRHAEEYYKSMLWGGPQSWNIRDRHMMDTLDRLLAQSGEGARAIVWAHNTHVGDYRATPMAENGLVNIGGLAREKYGIENVYLVGFGTYTGDFVAGGAWGGSPKTFSLAPAAPGSYENYLHRAAQSMGTPNFFMDFPRPRPASFNIKRGHRAVGVVYEDSYESRGYSYVPTRLGDRYDAFVFLDRTSALQSVPTDLPSSRLLPETWPLGQ